VAVNSIWLLGFASVEFVLADRQVRREEAYLESLFGGAYADYRTRVRRWV
jgi:protein-S-isoprenylcysteine O-methyltransferase Ste14